MSPAQLVVGQCRYCGCTEEAPCFVTIAAANGRLTIGCWWMNREQTVCSIPACQLAAIEDGILPPNGVVYLSLTIARERR
jgi:hypothetical protein